MKLQCATVESFGTFEAPVDVEFGDGATVVHGPNESGKSTLLRALWTVLTWRPTTRADFVTEMYPHHGGTPRIQLEFDRADTHYHLDKHFEPDRGVARLIVENDRGETTHHEGERVERMLRDVLGMGEARGHNAYPDHHGLWPLLWVRQWESHRNPGKLEALTESGRNAVARQVARSMDEVFGGRLGTSLTDEIGSKFEQFWTPTGRPIGRRNAEIVEAQEEVEEAEAHLEELRSRRETYRETLETYRTAGDEVERLESDVPRLERKLDEIESRIDESEELYRRLERARLRLRAAEAEADRAIQHVEHRRRLREELDDRREARRRADAIAGWIGEQLRGERTESEDDDDTEAPRELHELRERLEAAEAALERLHSRLATNGDAAEDDMPDPLSSLFDSLRATRRTLESYEDRIQLEREEAAWRERIHHLDGRLSEIESNLRDDVEAHGTDEALEERRRETVRTQRLAREEVERLEEQLEAIDLGTLRERAEQLRRRYESKRRELEEARRRRLALRARLEAADVEGLDEAIAEAEAELDRARDHLDDLERRADTWKLLHRTLQRARTERQSELLDPLRQRVTEWVRRVVPETHDLELDETLSIEAARREETIRETFDQMSGGSNEQLGLLVRIALADLIDEASSHPLVLDEPLTATDDARFEALVSVLNEATDRFQVLLTTWNWERYRRLGLDADRVHDLTDLDRDDVSIAS